MSGETIFAIACEMLQTTNIFSKKVSEIRYANNQHEEVCLLDLVEKEINRYNHRLRGKTEHNLQCAYDAIAKAMPKYIDNGYSAPFSFKQRTKGNFAAWLKRIGESYTVSNAYIPEELTADEEDTGIAMLKLLHAREGVTYEEIADELGIGERAIQKDLVKLSPSLYSGDKKPYPPFRLGGQPLLAEIELIQQGKSASEKRFRTMNSVHPLVLQENIMQLGTILGALCHQYHDYEDELSPLIAIDIWSQMSEYAREKVKTYYAFDNQDLKHFIDMLEDECPDDHVCGYHTERELLNEIEMPIDQALRYLMKVEGRTGTIILKDGKHIQVHRLHPSIRDDGLSTYEAFDCDGNSVVFTKNQVVDILLH